MGQKVNPNGFRLSVKRNWKSIWYFDKKDYTAKLKEDIKIRSIIRKKIDSEDLGKIIIERISENLQIYIYSARPGKTIGKVGEDVNKIKKLLSNITRRKINIEISRITEKNVNANYIAKSISSQLEKRMPFRKSIRKSMKNAIKCQAKGIKIMCSGRLNGIEIARSEWYKEGRMPLHTLKSDIDYSFSKALTIYGIIGVKVWIYHGDKNSVPKEIGFKNCYKNNRVESEINKDIKNNISDDKREKLFLNKLTSPKLHESYDNKKNYEFISLKEMNKNK